MAQHGPNAIRTHHVSAWAVLGRQLNNAVLILLAVTAVLSYFLGDNNQALIIGVILAASIGLGFVNEYRAEQAAAALHSRIRHTADRATRREIRRCRCPGPGPRRCDPTLPGTGRARGCAIDPDRGIGMRRKHPVRGIHRLRKITNTGAGRRRADRYDRSGVHGHDRERRRGPGRRVCHRQSRRVRPDRGRFERAATRDRLPGRSAPVFLSAAASRDRPDRA